MYVPVSMEGCIISLGSHVYPCSRRETPGLDRYQTGCVKKDRRLSLQVSQCQVSACIHALVTYTTARTDRGPKTVVAALLDERLYVGTAFVVLSKLARRPGGGKGSTGGVSA